ncbi:putative DNA binding domain-containing protein [Candidatus Acetothermia bacterium]|nr:putative DNA binding domain-containing protein [Candidatus Acetothermia bacterium]
MIVGGESDTLEFKKSTGQLTRAAETLCAFLNANGGTVIIGVTPQGKIVGQQVSDKTQQEIANVLQKFEPPAPVEIKRIPLSRSHLELILLEAVPSGEALPFTLDGRPYQRVGTTTSVMPQERYQQLLLNRSHSKHRWENAPVTEIQVKDLDREEILRTVRTGISVGRLPESTGKNPTDILDRLGLRVDGKLLNAAVVLFGTRFLPDYPQCHLRLARFKGIDKTEFLDNRQLHGHAFQLLDEAMFFLQRHLPVAGRIEPGRLERRDEPLFPLEALREALVNAICHRDYTHPGGAISLAIYDDRLEIWSEGTLPFGLKVEDLKRDHPSRLRNPLIAGVFYRRGLVEQWGRGTQKIVELCVKAGHPEPEFIEQARTVGVRFLPSGYIAPHRVTLDLTARQRELLHLLSQKGAMPLREIRAGMKNPPADRTLQVDLAHLKRSGLIDSSGRGRGARYWLRRDT